MNTKGKKDITLYYGLAMATYSIGFVTMSAFSSVYLLDIGLSNGAIGILLAIASVVSVALEPVVGELIDRNPYISSRRMLLFLGVMVAAIGVCISFIPDLCFDIKTVLYGLDIMLLMLAQPFLNSLAMDGINNGYPMHFGIGRGMGSVGYALGSFAFGRISVIVGPKSIPVAFSLAFLIFSILIFIYPVKETHNPNTVNTACGSAFAEPMKEKGSAFLFLARYRKFSVLLLGLILIYFSHCLINTFALQVVMPKGGTSGSMGMASGIAAVCELITTLFFVRIMKRVSMKILLRTSGVFFTLKIFFSLIVPNMFTFYLIQGLQMFGWGIMAVGIVFYVNNLVDENDRAQGQAYAGMAYTIASVIANFLGGNIIDIYGVNAMLIVGTLSAAAGTAIIWGMIEETPRFQVFGENENDC